jgi:hypothetical protein
VIVEHERAEALEGPIRNFRVARAFSCTLGRFLYPDQPWRSFLGGISGLNYDLHSTTVRRRTLYSIRSGRHFWYSEGHTFPVHWQQKIGNLCIGLFSAPLPPSVTGWFAGNYRVPTRKVRCRPSLVEVVTSPQW